MPIIRNINDLQKLIEGRISLAMKMTQNEIYKVIQEHIKNYYEEKVFRNKDGTFSPPSAIPFLYDRTYQFLNSLIKTDIKKYNGSLYCSVEIDIDSLEYEQDANIVIDMINRGFHADTSLNGGNYDTPYDIHAKSNFWDDAMYELGGYFGILDIYRKNLKKVGIPIK